MRTPNIRIGILAMVGACIVSSPLCAEANRVEPQKEPISVRRLLPCRNRPVFGLGYVHVIGNRNGWRGDEQKFNLVHARSLAADMQANFMNQISLLGPLLWDESDRDEHIAPLVDDMHQRGLSVYFALNTFMDWGKRMEKFRWVAPNGTANPDKQYFCMVAGRQERVPEIIATIKKAIDTGFDGVELDFFDWGIKPLDVCYCPHCVKAFNKWAQKDFSRESLADKVRNNAAVRRQWLEWKNTVRNEIASEVVKAAHDYAARKGRSFRLRVCAGGVSNHTDDLSGQDIFDQIGPMTYGSVEAGTIKSYEFIRNFYADYRTKLDTAGNTAPLVAFLNAGWGNPPPYKTTGKEMRKLALAAMRGGADGWMFFPEKVCGEEWLVLRKTVIESKIIYLEQVLQASPNPDLKSMLVECREAFEEKNLEKANQLADELIKTILEVK